PEGIERADLHGRLDLAARNRGARWRPEYELRRGTGGDKERGARGRAQAGRRRGQPVTATRLVEGQVAEARHPADGRDRRRPAQRAPARIVAERNRHVAAESGDEVAPRVRSHYLHARRDRLTGDGVR